MFFAGGLSAFASPPLYWLPLFWLACVPLVLAALRLQRRPLVWAILLFWTGRQFASLYWVVLAPTYVVGDWGWLLGLGMVLSITLMSLVAGLVLSIPVAFYLRSPSARLVALVVVLSLQSAALHWVFTGFPWGLAGYDLMFSRTLANSAAFIGVYGLTLINFSAVLLALGAWFLRSKALFVIALAAPAAAMLLGAWHLASATNLKDPGKPITIRVVQPNIPQADKWQPDSLQRSLAKLVQLSRADKALADVDMIVWPETAIAANKVSPDFYQTLAQAIGYQGYLLAGKPEVEQGGKLYNIAIVLDADGQEVHRYRKSHLVPFGEYFPLDFLVPQAYKKFVPSFDAGNGIATVRLNERLIFSTIICYEVIFPNEVWRGERPRFLVNITNDAWYGDTAGPWQHYAMSQMRAIEEGIPLVRSANTGISGLINVHGDSIKRLGLSTQGAFSATIPPRLETTFFSRFGNLVFYLLILALLGLALKHEIKFRRQP